MQQKPLKILLVEDDIGIRDVMSLVLSLEGFEVISLPDGRDVFGQVGTEHPDLVLLDVMLGDLDGRVICEALKSDPTTEQIPVMIVSASHGYVHDHLQTCRANDFLSKPFDINELIAKVKRLAA
ncbi:response regulator transcription factor [Mucilaginibacter myungsuensis]|uniref:Response regulator transcription factor n=1 Tax=Mucilaginibacter myungsuensis TaxID=649104 RepID=A0A929KUN1_9SPHI|nr:response regulator transcription factor [Mucilaginibacter myungsuensis]MBE9660760.1 response regulator transcription factor [Mucilaginibacter myungsuensis]MDN3600805.1 response regulator transcription factor [Mucilaginibacter myungsuensis]